MLEFNFGKGSDQLFRAVLSLKTKKECEKFFRDLCTLSELKAMTERFAIVQKVAKKESYRKIAQETGASTATVTRVASWFVNGMGGYKLVLRRLHHQ